MPLSKNMMEVTLKPGHEWPHRFMLRDGNDWYRILDLQVSIEKSGMSVYLHSPMDGLFACLQARGKLQPPVLPTLKLDLPRTLPPSDATLFNPYISWHGTGRIHSNAYESRGLSKSKLISDSEAVSIKDIGAQPDIILTAILPISTLSYYRTSPPPPEFDGNYLEISRDPLFPNVTNRPGGINLVLDRAALRPGVVIMDIMAHSQGEPVDLTGDGGHHPYPHDAEMYSVSQPITINPKDKSLPAISFWMYQPINTSAEDLVQTNPLILWGRTRFMRDDQIFQAFKAT